MMAKKETLRVESAFLVNSLLKSSNIELVPTIKMNLAEVNMCIMSRKEDLMVDVNGLMAELLNDDGVVVKTKGEGFAAWLLKLYLLCCQYPCHLLNEEH